MSAEAPSTIANVGIVAVATTSSTIQAGIVKSAIIDNFLAFVASKACMAGAFEAVDQVSANTAILTGVRATFVNIKVAIRSTETYGKKIIHQAGGHQDHGVYFYNCFTLLMMDAKNMLLAKSRKTVWQLLLSSFVASWCRIVGNLCHRHAVRDDGIGGFSFR